MGWPVYRLDYLLLLHVLTPAFIALSVTEESTQPSFPAVYCGIGHLPACLHVLLLIYKSNSEMQKSVGNLEPSEQHCAHISGVKCNSMFIITGQLCLACFRCCSSEDLLANMGRAQRSSSQQDDPKKRGGWQAKKGEGKSGFLLDCRIKGFLLPGVGHPQLLSATFSNVSPPSQ